MASAPSRLSTGAHATTPEMLCVDSVPSASLFFTVSLLPTQNTNSAYISWSQSECALDRYQLLPLECTVTTAIDPQGRWIAITKVAMEPDLEGDQ